MGLSSFFRRFGSKAVDSAVGFADGKTPVPLLETNKSAFAMVVVVGVVVLGYLSLLLWFNVHRVYVAMHPKSVTNTVAASAELEALKTKDTDHDGLSDYDELFFYHSSPYLFSTAGDGISDGVKAQKGENPSCAENTTCNPTPTVNVNGTGNSNSSLTPDFLRSALKAAGVADSTLNNTNDSDLLSIYNKVVGQTPSSNGNTSATSALTMDQLQSMSGSEVRSLLVANGISASTLSTVDDATLQQIFQQVISQDSNTNSSNVN